MQIRVEGAALLSALEAARRLWPNEFVGLLKGDVCLGRQGDCKSILVKELVLAPFSNYEESCASWRAGETPIGMGIVGTFHSHPTRSASPSKEDLWCFAKLGFVHFIATPPFRLQDVHAYISSGQRMPFAIIGRS